MDEDGYPTEDAIKAVMEIKPFDFDGMIELLGLLWIYPTYIQVDKKENEPAILSISTGGWSGHEEIIEAMQKNHEWWLCHWLSSRRGGHYEFQPIYSSEVKK